MKKVQLGEIRWTKIESNYDLSNWKKGGGPSNKISDIDLEVEVETNLTDQEFSELKEMSEKLCPIYQVITGSGVKVNSVWRLKKLN